MRILTFILAGLALSLAFQPAHADDDQKYLIVKKRNHTQMIALDPVTAGIVEKSIQEGKRVNIRLPQYYAPPYNHYTYYDPIDDEDEEYCDRRCKRLNQEAYQAGRITGRLVDND